MIIAFLGPPGSGKGTQAKLLMARHGFLHFDTGSRLREEIASGSKLGERIAQHTHQGNLVPLDVIKDLISKFLDETTAERIMFDGFPRSLDQAKILAVGLQEKDQGLAHVVYLEIDESALLERVTNRRFCEGCGAIYNIATNPPDGPCPTGAAACKLVQRKDDTPEVFAQRLEVYMRETWPVLDYYKDLGLLRKIDGDRAIEVVYAAMVCALDLADVHA